MRKRKARRAAFAGMRAGLAYFERRARKARDSHERWIRAGYQALAWTSPPLDLDKSDWGPGPWQAEPDYVCWADLATGLQCRIKRNHAGAWCGYVGIPESRRARRRRARQGLDFEVLEVHGGVTFNCQIGPERWIGFDCAHYGDLCPLLAATMRKIGSPLPAFMRGDEYRDLPYVTAEVERLAAQLAAWGQAAAWGTRIRIPLTWCSFATDAGCLGVVILPGAFTPATAAVACHALGLNPGGEMLSFVYPADAPEREYLRGLENTNRLLSPAEARELLDGRALRELDEEASNGGGDGPWQVAGT